MNSTRTDQEELHLGKLLAALWRQKFWILAGGAGGIVFAAIHSAKTPPLWEGGFEVVIAKQSSSGLISQLGSSPVLGALGLGFSSGNNGADLETELRILQSQSVLKPVLDEVNALKYRRGSDSQRLSLSSWKQNLSVKLAKGTSILRITYRDQDKDLILPVLLRISEAYQRYSGRERRESLENGLNYAQQQVLRFRAKAAASTRAADAFRIQHGISAGGAGLSGSGIDVNALLPQNASSATPSLSVQSGGTSQLQSMGDPLSQLASLNQELIRRRQIFTERDPSVVALKRERDVLRSYIEQSAGGSLATPSGTTLTKQQAQDVVLRYQELERMARRDTTTLDSLENTLLSLQLEQARASKPWEMISSPTLLDSPVGPRTNRSLALGLLAGLCAGGAVGLLAERQRGLVFNQDDLTSLLPYPLLAELRGDPDHWTPTLQLLVDGPLAETKGLALIPAGTLDERANSLLTALKPLLTAATQLEVCRDLHQASGFQHQLLVASPGSATRIELEQLQRKLLLQGRPVLGLVLL